MRVKTWRVLDRGTVPDTAAMVPVSCICGYEAAVPYVGRPLAAIGQGVVFDVGVPHALPPTIQCRKCGRVLCMDDACVR